jgi:hypothetical protein
MKDINYYKSKYPVILRQIAYKSGWIKQNGGITHNIKNLNTINSEMWLIECEESKMANYPYCIYYHESGNIYGLIHFNDDTFIDTCKSFLNTVWGIIITE